MPEANAFNDDRFEFEKTWPERAINAARNAFSDAKTYFGFGEGLKEMEDYGYWRDRERGRYRTHEAKQAPEKTWPSRQFWQKYGPSDYDDNAFFVDKLGNAQSLALNAADAVTVGIPLAIARRFAPDVAKPIDDVRRNNGDFPRYVGELAGAAASPARHLLRGLGDKAAEKGYGTAVQAAADGIGAMAVTSAAPLIEGNANGLFGTNYAGPAAFASRYAMPKLPPELSRRIGIGAAAGATSQLVPTAIDSNYANLLVGALAGAQQGAFGRGPKTGQSYRDALRHEQRYSEDITDSVAAFFRGTSNPYSNRAMNVAMPLAGGNAAITLANEILADESELPPDPRRAPQAAYPKSGY